MKKILLAAICLSTILTFTACSSQVSTSSNGVVTYKDGTYEAEGKTDEKNGYTPKVTVTVAGGKITDVEYNAFTADGKNKKTESQPGGTYDMKTAGAKKDWYEQAELLEAKLIESQDPAAITVDSEGKTDAVAGVSMKAGDFVTLATEALSSAK